MKFRWTQVRTGRARLVAAMGAVSVLLAACSDDESPIFGDDGGAPIVKPDGGVEAAPDAQDGGDAQGDADATTGDAEAGDAADAGDAEAGPSGPLGLFVASDYAQSTLAAVDLATGEKKGTLAGPDGDTIVYASGGRGFLLGRASGRVVVLDPAAPWQASSTIDVGVDGGSANPYAAIVAAGSKAYVVRYGQNTVDVIDTSAGSVTGTLDLSPFADAADPQPPVDAVDGAFDPATGRVYFLLQRIDATDFSATCIAAKPAIVAFDSATDQVVDLNGAAAGEALELAGSDPGNQGGFVADFANHRLVVVHSGCHESDGDGGTTVARAGVEIVDLALGTSSWQVQSTLPDQLWGFVWVDASHAYVGSGYPTAWRAWDPSQTTFGAVETGIPPIAASDGAGHLVGLVERAADGGTSLDVVSYDVVTKQATTVASDVFTGSGLHAYGAAVLP